MHNSIMHACDGQEHIDSVPAPVLWKAPDSLSVVHLTQEHFQPRHLIVRYWLLLWAGQN